MTFAFKTELGKQLGFRTDIIRGEDGSLALAMKPYGKLVFIHSSKARVITGYGTVGADGGLFKSFKVRFYQRIKRYWRIIHQKEKKYKDKDNNLIK